MILAVEAGVFPLMCGWWIDICAFVSELHVHVHVVTVSTACGVEKVPTVMNCMSTACFSLPQSLFGSTMTSRQDSLQRAPGQSTISIHYNYDTCFNER